MSKIDSQKSRALSAFLQFVAGHAIKKEIEDYFVSGTGKRQNLRSIIAGKTIRGVRVVFNTKSFIDSLVPIEMIGAPLSSILEANARPSVSLLNRTFTPTDNPSTVLRILNKRTYREVVTAAFNVGSSIALAVSSSCCRIISTLAARQRYLLKNKKHNIGVLSDHKDALMIDEQIREEAAMNAGEFSDFVYSGTIFGGSIPQSSHKIDFESQSYKGTTVNILRISIHFK